MSINPQVIHPDVVSAAEREDKRILAENFKKFLAMNEAESQRLKALAPLTIRIPPLMQLQAPNRESNAQLMPKDELPLFNRLPWYTDVIEHSNDMPEVQGLVKLISEKEDALFTGEPSNSFYEALISSDDTISQVVRNFRPDRMTTVQATRTLLLYRVLDVIAFSQSLGCTDSAVPRTTFPTLTIPGWGSFCSDWPRFIREAGTLLYQTVPENPSGLEANTQMDITAKHLQSICRHITSKDRNKMLINFELAATYLSSLLKGEDYPDTILELAQAHNLNLQQLEDFASRSGTHGLRLPLHLALAVSPCVLFLQTTLHKQEIGRLSLLEASP